MVVVVGLPLIFQMVLIVAKCIVNILVTEKADGVLVVLIVAKCIVNKDTNGIKKNNVTRINSSKVYCKLRFSSLKLSS